jgi:hypothetical protein
MADGDAFAGGAIGAARVGRLMVLRDGAAAGVERTLGFMAVTSRPEAARMRRASLVEGG